MSNWRWPARYSKPLLLTLLALLPMVSAHHFFRERPEANRRAGLHRAPFGKERQAMKWLLISIGLLAAAFCQGCCRPGGLFNQSSGYYGSYPLAAPMAGPAPTYSSYPANACTCQ